MADGQKRGYKINAFISIFFKLAFIFTVFTYVGYIFGLFPQKGVSGP
jgi:hypothetical protein